MIRTTCTALLEVTNESSDGPREAKRRSKPLCRRKEQNINATQGSGRLAGCVDPLFSLECGLGAAMSRDWKRHSGPCLAKITRRSQTTGSTGGVHHGADRAFDDHGFGRQSTSVAQAVSFQPLPIKLSAKNKSVPYTSMQEYEEIARVDL